LQFAVPDFTGSNWCLAGDLRALSDIAFQAKGGDFLNPQA
jgi:hypothetical protein